MPGTVSEFFFSLIWLRFLVLTLRRLKVSIPYFEIWKIGFILDGFTAKNNCKLLTSMEWMLIFKRKPKLKFPINLRNIFSEKYFSIANNPTSRFNFFLWKQSSRITESSLDQLSFSNHQNHRNNQFSLSWWVLKRLWRMFFGMTSE